MDKYEEPKLVDITELTEAQGQCMIGSSNIEDCVGGGTVIPNCSMGGVPTAICTGGGSF